MEPIGLFTIFPNKPFQDSARDASTRRAPIAEGIGRASRLQQIVGAYRDFYYFPNLKRKTWVSLRKHFPDSARDASTRRAPIAEGIGRASRLPLSLDTREARSGGLHKLGDRKGKGQSTPHAKGARKGKTSFRVTTAPGSGIEFVDVGMQCPSNVIWYGGICVRVHMRAYVHI